MYFLKLVYSVFVHLCFLRSTLTILRWHLVNRMPSNICIYQNKGCIKQLTIKIFAMPLALKDIVKFMTTDSVQLKMSDIKSCNIR